MKIVVPQNVRNYRMFGFQCVHLNVRSVLFILLSVVLNGISLTDTGVCKFTFVYISGSLQCFSSIPALHDGETTIRIEKNNMMSTRISNVGAD